MWIKKQQKKYATEKSVTYFDLIFLKHNNLMKAATISINANAFSAIYDLASGT